jgi:hypothetical protein
MTPRKECASTIRKLAMLQHLPAEQRSHLRHLETAFESLSDTEIERLLVGLRGLVEKANLMEKRKPGIWGIIQSLAKQN